MKNVGFATNTVRKKEGSSLYPLTVNDILQDVSGLSIEDQDFLVQTLTKRLAELRRRQIVERIQEAEANYQSGKVTIGTVADLMNQV